jgi:hypothetical protein
LGTILFVKQNLSSAEDRLRISFMRWRNTTGGMDEEKWRKLTATSEEN